MKLKSGSGDGLRGNGPGKGLGVSGTVKELSLQNEGTRTSSRSL